MCWARALCLAGLVGACIPEPVLRPRDAATDGGPLTDLAHENTDVVDAVGDTVDANAADVTCDVGAVAREGACVTLNAARPVWPLSSQAATHRRPTLRWSLAPESDAARVEICRDRACASPVSSFTASGTSAQPPDELSAGPVFWRVWARAGAVEAQRPSATWQVHVPWRSGTVNTAQRDVIDANGDGYSDIVVGLASGEVRTYLGSRAGPRAATTIADAQTDARTFTIARGGDANGDGRSDLLLRRAAEWAVYYGAERGFDIATSTALQHPSVSAPVGAANLAGDLNGDGFTDIIEVSAGGGVVTFIEYLGSGAGAMTGVRRPSSESAIASVGAMGDLDGDGFEDLVGLAATGDGGTPESVVLVRAGSEALTRHSAAPREFTVRELPLGRLDFNGDRAPDLVASSGSPYDRVPIALGARGGFDPTIAFVATLGMASSSFCATDFNGDGFADVVLSIPGTNVARVHLGGPQGVAAAGARQITFTAARVPHDLRCPGDVNGDGAGDVVGVFHDAARDELYFIPGGDDASTPAPDTPFDAVPRNTGADRVIVAP